MLMFNLFNSFWGLDSLYGGGFIRPIYINVYTNSTEEAKEVTEEESKNHKECEALRKEFSTFINSLDDSLFKQVCRSFTNQELDDMNNVIFGYCDDKEALEKAIATFKAKNNEIITEKIMALKSQMV